MTHPPHLPLLHGRYLLRQPLGVGGMGAVYLAEDQNLAGKLVAIKQNTETAAEVQHQFNREAVLLANLKHPALPAVTDYFIEPDGRQYLVMEYIEGKDLGEILEENGSPLPEPTALGWITTVIDALEYLHNRTKPIIHRDVKPANIKLKTDGQIYLVDFGLAKIEESGITHPGARAYTAGYAPFEQYGGGTSTRSDIYALGATLYTLLTGAVPPEAPLLISGDALPAPRQLNPNITPNTEQIILRAMALRPEDRFQTMAEMRTALAKKSARPTQRFPPPRRRRNRGIVVLLIGLVAAIGLALATYATDSALERRAVRLWANRWEATPPPTPAPPTATPLPVAVALAATPTASPMPTATTAVVLPPPPTLSPTATPPVTPTLTPSLTPTLTPLPTLPPTVTATPVGPNPVAPAATAAPCPTGMALVTGDTHAFCLGSHEVTNAEYRACDEEGIEACMLREEQKSGMPIYTGPATYYDDPQYNDYPVVNITVAQAQSYCTEYLEYKHGLPLRLPTFDEWMAAYAQTIPTSPQVDHLLPVMDLQLSLTGNDIRGVIDNVKEWVVIALAPDGDIEQAMAAGGSFEGEAFPIDRAELDNYEAVEGRSDRQDYTIGFRCALSL